MKDKNDALPRYYLYLNHNGELTAQLSDEAMQVCIIRTLTALKTLTERKEAEAYQKGYNDAMEEGITI